MKHFIDGKRIYLRKVRLTDANKDYLRWMNDKEVTRYLVTVSRKYSMRDLRSHIRKINRDSRYIFLAIITKEDNRHIGNIKIGPIDFKHRFADIGIMIGEKSYWGKGFATEALKLVINHALTKLKLHKLIAGSYANNKATVRLFKKCGFNQEGQSKKKYFYMGRYVDEVNLSLISTRAR